MRGERDEKDKGRGGYVRNRGQCLEEVLSVFILYKTQANDLGLFVHECVYFNTRLCLCERVSLYLTAGLLGLDEVRDSPGLCRPS